MKQSRILTLVRKYAHLLHCSHWNIEVEFVPGTDLIDSSRANCKMLPTVRQATILLNDNFLKSQDEYDISLTIIHELIHLVLALPMARINTDDAFDEMVLERSINDITYAIVDSVYKVK